MTQYKGEPDRFTLWGWYWLGLGGDWYARGRGGGAYVQR